MPKKTSIYFIPGLAANSSIFKNINLDSKLFDVHFLEWLMPKKNESLSAYALRFSKLISQPNPVLVGVSFGGVLAQEINNILDLKKLIIISSVKSKTEFPLKFQIARKTKAYKLVPTSLAKYIDLLFYIAITESSKHHLELYKKYLSINDKHYLDWAIEQIVNWDQQHPDPNLIHIHGSNDSIFPIQYIKESIIIDNGNHAMILNKARWFNSNLPDLILN